MKKNINEIKGTLLSNKQMKDLKGGLSGGCYGKCYVNNVSGTCHLIGPNDCACSADRSGDTGC